MMKPNIGISDENREGVTKILNDLLADEYLLYTKLRKFHWNVRGPEFNTLHQLFEDQYTEVEVIVDDVAERVGTVGGVALGTLEEFKEHSRLKEAPGKNPKAMEMVQEVVSDQEQIIKRIRNDAKVTAEQFSDLGTESFLSELLEQHEKMSWMLRSHLED